MRVRPDVDVSEAESVKVPLPRVLSEMELKVIDWLALLKVKVRLDEVALLKLVSLAIVAAIRQVPDELAVIVAVADEFESVQEVAVPPAVMA